MGASLVVLEGERWEEEEEGEREMKKQGKSFDSLEGCLEVAEE